MLDLHRLRLLTEFARRGTIARTAAVLGYTPSAVSQQLAALEREAGIRLTERAGRGIGLTPAADILVAHASALLARLDEDVGRRRQANAPPRALGQADPGLRSRAASCWDTAGAE